MFIADFSEGTSLKETLCNLILFQNADFDIAINFRNKPSFVFLPLLKVI